MRSFASYHLSSPSWVADDIVHRSVVVVLRKSGLVARACACVDEPGQPLNDPIEIFSLNTWVPVAGASPDRSRLMGAHRWPRVRDEMVRILDVIEPLNESGLMVSAFYSPSGFEPHDPGLPAGGSCWQKLSRGLIRDMSALYESQERPGD